MCTHTFSEHGIVWFLETRSTAGDHFRLRLLAWRNVPLGVTRMYTSLSNQYTGEEMRVYTFQVKCASTKSEIRHCRLYETSKKKNTIAIPITRKTTAVSSCDGHCTQVPRNYFRPAEQTSFFFLLIAVVTVRDWTSSNEHATKIVRDLLYSSIHLRPFSSVNPMHVYRTVCSSIIIIDNYRSVVIISYAKLSSAR